MILKLKILGLGLLSIAIALSVVYGAEVDLPGFGSYQDNLATYAYTTCLEKIGLDNGKYSCNNFILTLNSENGGRNKDAVNKHNKNGSKDHGLCQLNSTYHNKFIKSEDFKDPSKQIDYCLGVWIDAKNKGTMPRYGYKVRHKRDKGIRFIEPPLSDKITDPVPTKSPKVKKICRQVGTIKKDEYLQIDNKFHQFKLRLRDLWVGDTVFICKDL